ncbi:fused DSP-PTPase phosphatase/NAD kinase-like protein [Thiomicrospira sp. S5]|jgi:Protein tyrosine/serine phosphatase|uniref:fused DSP-PTPase phosphatase/NAD kinase-like protein n=1 Tax=Thiomicrospira sp. S5 TaxID=1803865 RepID=UPI000F89F0B5|nr:tyrosine-protein phosphatase [Thiomicrospira sp. S5]AZR81829.1 protein-tyrosine-phosphatase [Thiomicrospira sp. S5]
MEKLQTKWGRFKAHIEAWLVDHEILRFFYRNFHRLSENAFRSNHPSPAFIKKLKQKYGISTIISLRRADNTGQYQLEKEACERHGITLINHPMSSRSFPDVDRILQAKKILETAEYPILIHCKSGADRAGMMSVFYKHFILKQPISEALSELSMKYGHFRWADTGKLDVFFDTFLAFEKENPDTTFIEWVENHYDKPKLNQEFHAAGWANIVVNRILKRE